MNRSKQHRINVFARAASAVAAVGMALAANPVQGADEFAAGEKTLSVAELESRVQAQGIKLTEMEIEGLLLEVEGRDAEGREVELVLDRRTGEILSKRFDD
ncbi:MAG: PepSY domain-containing protein [Steroidobacter sp.]